MGAKAQKKSKLCGLCGDRPAKQEFDFLALPVGDRQCWRKTCTSGFALTELVGDKEQENTS